MPKTPLSVTDDDVVQASTVGAASQSGAKVPVGITADDYITKKSTNLAGTSRNLESAIEELRNSKPLAGVAETLPILGGIAGSEFGGVPGAAVGGFSGQLLKDWLQNNFDPNIWGSPKGSFLADVTGAKAPIPTALANATQEGIWQGGAQKGINLVTKIGGATLPVLWDRARGVSSPGVRQRLAERFFTPHPFAKDPEDVKAATKLNLEPSTHQTTGSPAAGTLEFGPGKTALQVKQQGKLEETFNKLRSTIRGEPYNPVGSTVRKSTQEYAAPAREGALAHHERLKAEENSWFNRFKAHAEENAENFLEFKGWQKEPEMTGTGNMTSGTPNVEPIRVSGPIYLDKAKAAAGKILPELKILKSGQAYEGMPAEFKAEVSSLYNTIEDLVRPTQVVNPGTGELESVYVKPWETIKKLRTDIEEVTKGAFRKTYEKAGLQNIKSALGEDIKDSVSSKWATNPEEAAYTLERANMATKSRAYVFDNKVAKMSMFKEGDIRRDANLSEFFQRGYKNQDTARELVNAMGYNNRRYIAGDYIDNVLVKEGATPESIIRELEDPNSVSRVFINAKERAGIMQWARGARAVAPSPTTPGNFALVYNGARFALTVATTPFTGVGPRQIYAGAGLGVITLGRSAIRDILLNTDTAKLAARLTKIPPTSIEAAAASKALLKAIQGTRVLVSFGQGATQGGTVTPQGKIAMDQGQE